MTCSEEVERSPRNPKAFWWATWLGETSFGTQMSIWSNLAHEWLAEEMVYQVLSKLRGPVKRS